MYLPEDGHMSGRNR